MSWSGLPTNERRPGLPWLPLMERRAWFGRVARTGFGCGALLALADPIIARDGDGRQLTDTMLSVMEGLDASGAMPTSAIELDVPGAAWTGALVAVRIDARKLSNVRQLHLLRDAPFPVEIASMTLAGVPDARATGLPAVVSLPVRIEEPCRLRVLALTDTGWFRQDAQVQEVGTARCGVDSDASRR